MGWLKQNWKSVLITTAVFVAVAAAVTLGGALIFGAAVAVGTVGAAILAGVAALAAGGAAGYVGYLLQTPPAQRTKQGAWTAVGIGALLGLVGNVAGGAISSSLEPVVAPVVSRLLPGAAPAIATQVTTRAASAVGGAATAAALQGAMNGASGRPLGENVGPATFLGAAGGALGGGPRRASPKAAAPPVELPSNQPAIDGIVAAWNDMTRAGRNQTLGQIWGKLSSAEKGQLLARLRSIEEAKMAARDAAAEAQPHEDPPERGFVQALTGEPSVDHTQSAGVPGSGVAKPGAGPASATPGPEAPAPSSAAKKPGAPLDLPLGEDPPETFAAWKSGIPTPGLKDPIADTSYFAKEVPGFQQQLSQLEGQGWKIGYGEPGEGSSANAQSSPPTITLDPSSDPLATFKSLAHEVGHALEPPDPVRDPMTMSRSDYVAAKLHDMALSEGRAVLNEANVLEAFRKSVAGRTGTSPDLPYQGPYRLTAQNARLTPDQKIEQIGLKYMSRETPSNGTNQTYNQYWTDLFGAAWNKAHGQ